ncbi:guanylate kinase [Buchnera aphidicola]|uniref:guanylate kinase n=1 Tax=Buchnera aphidicola TaxID=9 RepID=UPI002092E0B4|nr:guanylate kinase [Buchnera aphidicola]USS94400.1 guanylate kinase [Buchnera aphidicola (Sipha maydis)]WII23560.1 guanylate kinase [Buchnera aphidicola (Sipha maydis)]
MKNVGRIFILSAPSGTGKSSLIKSFLKKEQFLEVKMSISYTTRLIRPGERHGIDYYFISKKKFKLMIKKKKFLEYAKVFNNYYGTPLIHTQSILFKGQDILLDIDWQGARQIKKIFLNAKSIFLLPPSKDELFNRLKKRNQDDQEVIFHRMKKFIKETSHYLEYDYLIINDNFNDAISHLKTIICSYRLSTSYQSMKYKKLIQNLLCRD